MADQIVIPSIVSPTLTYTLKPDQIIRPFDINNNSVHELIVGRTALVDPTTSPGIFSSIWAWITSQSYNWAIVFLIAAMCAQIFRNYTEKKSRLGTPLALAMLVSSLWIGFSTGNQWIGGVMGILSLGLLIQASTFKDKQDETEEEEENKSTLVVPDRNPIRAPPTHMGIGNGYSGPSIGIPRPELSFGFRIL